MPPDLTDTELATAATACRGHETGSMVFALGTFYAAPPRPPY